jgi:hypothetical protein
MMMEIPENCIDVQNALHLYVGADLETEVQVAVARHLEACAGCRAQADDAQAARAALLVLKSDAPPAISVWSDVRAQLLREGRIAGAPVARRSPWWIVPAAAAASVAAVLLTLAVQNDANRVLPNGAQPSAPDAPQPIVLHPVEAGAAPIFDDSAPRVMPFDPSFSGASAAGNQRGGAIVPFDSNEIIR